jgi:hypothetical protein
VDDRYGEKAGTEGRVKVTVLREDFAEEKSHVSGFIIEDNGIGLDEDNYRSFLRPDSRHKIGRGGKGIDRLGWLKVFSVIEIDSTYDSQDGLVKRSFDFRLTDEEQVATRDARPACPLPPGTRVALRDFKAPFLHKCPTDPEVILQKLASHFLLHVVSDTPVPIIVEDGSKQVTLAAYYSEQVTASDIDEVELKPDDEPQTFVIQHLKVSRKFRPARGYNRMLLFGNTRRNASARS